MSTKQGKSREKQKREEIFVSRETNGVLPLPGRGDVSRETLGRAGLPPARAALFHYSLFTFHPYLFRQQGIDLLSCPFFGLLLAGRQPGTYSLFTIHYSFATRAQVCNLVRVSAPSSSSPRRRRGAPRGGGEEEALVQTKMDPCFYKMVFCKVASMA